MSKMSTIYKLSYDKMSITHKFSHDKIYNEIYYSDLSYKLITKRRKIMIIQYIISCYSSLILSTLSLLFSVFHSIISCMIITNYSSIHTLFVSASVLFFLLDESEFSSSFHSSSFSY